MNAQSPLLLNLDIVRDTAGNVTAITIQTDATKGTAYVLCNVEDAAANARYLTNAVHNSQQAAAEYDQNALGRAQEAIRRALLPDSQKASLLAMAQAASETVIVDQVP